MGIERPRRRPRCSLDIRSQRGGRAIGFDVGGGAQRRAIVFVVCVCARVNLVRKLRGERALSTNRKRASEYESLEAGKIQASERESQKRFQSESC